MANAHRWCCHTFGELVHFHPHLHALVTDGAFATDGTFIPLPSADIEPFEKLWQEMVFDLLLKQNKIDPSVVTSGVPRTTYPRSSAHVTGHAATIAAAKAMSCTRLHRVYGRTAE